MIRWRILGAGGDPILDFAKCVASADRYLAGEGIKNGCSAGARGPEVVSRTSGKNCRPRRASVGIRVQVQDGGAVGSAARNQYR